MSTFAAGFAAGERQAWKDRNTRVRSDVPEALTEYGRGFVAGYHPRSATWTRPVGPAMAWWDSRESEVA